MEHQIPEANHHLYDQSQMRMKHWLKHDLFPKTECNGVHHDVHQLAETI